MAGAFSFHRLRISGCGRPALVAMRRPTTFRVKVA
jgi:hypothetical protein